MKKINQKILLGGCLFFISTLAFAKVTVDVSNVQPSNNQVLIVNGKPVVVNDSNNSVIQNGKGVTYVQGNGGVVVIPGNSVSYVTTRDTTNGVIIVNGKTLSYPKCIPKNATTEQAQELKNQLANAKRASGNISINLDPNNLPDCQ